MNKKESISVVIKKSLSERRASFVVKEEKIEETIFVEIDECGLSYSCIYFFIFERPIENRSIFISTFGNIFIDGNHVEKFFENRSLTKNTFKTWMYRGIDIQSDIDALCLFLDTKYNSKNWEIIKINE
jgi:hypothetical protein